jgi:hypothetical protein
MMNSHEQEIALWTHAEQELMRLAEEIEALQEAFVCLVRPLRTLRHDIAMEQARDRLSKILVLLADEHVHLLNKRATLAHTLEHALERLVHSWGGEAEHAERAAAQTAYDQVITQWSDSRLALEQTERSIADIQYAYARLLDESQEQTEEAHEYAVQREHMSDALDWLRAEHTRWLAVQTETTRAIERTLEQQVHRWRGEVVHQEDVLAHAATPDERQAATHLRDEAQREVERHGHNLSDFLVGQASSAAPPEAQAASGEWDGDVPSAKPTS